MLKKAVVKKISNPRWRSRNGCDGRVITKFIITTQEFGVKSYSET